MVKLACVQCNKYIEYGRNDSGTSGGLICSPCSIIEKYKRKLVELETQIKDLNASVKFLRHEVVNEPTLGVRDGVVMIIVQGLTDQPLSAHKFILASRSTVFRKMFETKMQEEETGILQINDATLPVVRAMIKFCYDAKIEFTDEVTPEAVLEVAHKYGIGLLRRICEEDLTETLSEGNLPKRLKLARKFESTGLEAAAFQFFKDNFDEVICDVMSEFC